MNLEKEKSQFVLPTKNNNDKSRGYYLESGSSVVPWRLISSRFLQEAIGKQLGKINESDTCGVLNFSFVSWIVNVVIGGYQRSNHSI